MKKLTISIDFDDTIVKNEYPNIGILIKDSKRFINKLYADGHFIIINTCRMDRYERDAADYLFKKGVHFHTINQNQPGRITFFQGDCRKMSADIYIDDRNLGGIPSWEMIYNQITLQANG
jgi:hypothetical protein